MPFKVQLFPRLKEKKLCLNSGWVLAKEHCFLENLQKNPPLLTASITLKIEVK